MTQTSKNVELKIGKRIIRIHNTRFNQKKLFHLYFHKKVETIFQIIAQTEEYNSKNEASLGSLENSLTLYSTAFCETTVEIAQINEEEIIMRLKFLNIYLSSGKKFLIHDLRVRVLSSL